MNLLLSIVIQYCTTYILQTLDDSPHWIDLPKRNGDETFELPIPATYTIETDRKIRKAFVDTDYTRRHDPEEIIDELKKMK